MKKLLFLVVLISGVVTSQPLDEKQYILQSQKGAVVSIHDRVFTNSIEDVVGGDDYVLLFTCPSKHNELVKKILPNSIKLGSITQEKEILVTDKTGKNINFKNLGWDSL
mgnify:CR=1 FL=1